MQYKHIYGPVPSRRLGFSLGIDPVPFKYCSFNCIYCQLGKTTEQTIERKEYSPTEEILQDIKAALGKADHIDYLTFSGSGEPTLHSRIGYLIREVKKITKIPVAVLTNGSLIFMASVRKELLPADLVLPTLCSATQNVFQKINRAHFQITVEKIIEGLIKFRKMYKRKIWLEVMLVKGINDTLSEVNKLKEVIQEINPDKIHLNTVVRPPNEKYAFPLSIEELQKIKDIFGNNTEIIANFKTKRESAYLIDIKKTILDMIKRRPVTIDDICSVTGLHRNDLLKYLDQLHRNKKIKLTEHDGRSYYEIL